MSISVLINGAFGKMGQETVAAVQNVSDFKLVGTLGKEDSLKENILALNPQIVIDFTQPDVIYQNALIMIELNTHPVIGTTGLNENQISSLEALCKQKKLGAIIAPNFSIAAILMMKYAQDCISHLTAAEIIELHHDKKLDAPSGTAIKTAELMSKTLDEIHHKQTAIACKELIAGARGANKQGIPIHSIRLPGLLAHQEIIFGNEGETLTFRHDTISRKAFMPGVLLACRKVLSLKRLVYGLEHIL